jgi:hypothetical protein
VGRQIIQRFGAPANRRACTDGSSGPTVRDDFVSPLLGALRSGQVEFQDVEEVAHRFIPQQRFDLVTVKLDHEALFLSIAAYSLHTPQRFGFGHPLYSDEDYHSTLSIQMSRFAATLGAVNDKQGRSLGRLFLRTKSNKQDLIEQLARRSRVYYELKLSEREVMRKYCPISPEKRMQHDELLYLPTMREFLTVCSGTDASIPALNPSDEKPDAGKPKEVVTRSLLLRMQVALTKTQFAIQSHLKTSGLTQ